MPEIKISLPASKFQNMFINHIRYCLTRTTFSNDIGRKDIRTYWPLLNSTTRNIIICDVGDYIRTKPSGVSRVDEYFFKEWQKLLDWMKVNKKQLTTPQPLVSYLPVVDPKLMTSSSRQTS